MRGDEGGGPRFGYGHEGGPGVRGFVPAYEVRAPRSLAETLQLLEREPGAWRPFAGGTDIMVNLEAGKLAHRRWLSIWGLPELRGIEVAPDAVTLGALTTYTDVLENETLRREFPMLCLAAGETGAVAIQNRGTLGGNIANASPAADSPPALLCYDAEIELVSASGGARRLPYQGFHTGYKTTLMRPDELLRAIRLPRRGASVGGRLSAAEVHYYRKVGTRAAQAISKVLVAAFARLDPASGALAHVRIALGSVAPVTLRALKTEAAIQGRRPDDPALVPDARAALAAEISPIDDIRSTAEYRLKVAQNLVEEFLTSS